MYVYHYDFDNEKHGCNLEIEITYEKDHYGVHEADYRTIDMGHCLDLVHVDVTAIEGYDDGGEIVYRIAGSELKDHDWLVDLERYALQWVEDQIDYQGWLADDLWANEYQR
jgi:hypothetical protein